MSDIATGRDSDFSEERLILRYNTDLANSLGNLLNRTLSMAAKYREGKLALPNNLSDMLSEIPGAPNFALPETLKKFTAVMDSYEVSVALKEASSFATFCNMFVDFAKPWALAKDVAKSGELDAVLYALAESLRIIAILISPVMPKAARGILDQLDPEGKLSRDFRLADATWGGLKDGHVVGKPVPLFPRIEVPKEV